MVDKANKTVYDIEMKEAANNQEELKIEKQKSGDEVVMIKLDKSSKNTVSEDNSPDTKTKTHLVIADKDLKKLEV